MVVAGYWSVFCDTLDSRRVGHARGGSARLRKPPPKLYKDLDPAKKGREKELIQRQIDATDRQIDELLYRLYDLTGKEIRIVEGNTQ